LGSISFSRCGTRHIALPSRAIVTGAPAHGALRCSSRSTGSASNAAAGCWRASAACAAWSLRVWTKSPRSKASAGRSPSASTRNCIERAFRLSMPLNVPNLLTWLRILFIPAFLAVFYFPSSLLSESEKNLAATLLFAVAAVTGWLDGYLARTLDQTSAFGAFLDPVADKLMVAAALILLVWLGRVDAPVAVVIIGREIAVSALREWMAKIGRSKSVAVSFLGKIKT